jgi:predicted HicB family RNase H-like nuclease
LQQIHGISKPGRHDSDGVWLTDHRPHPRKEADKGAVKAVRRLLTEAGKDMVQYKGYTGVFEYDAEARTLGGEVIGLRDVITFQGDSIAEVERAFRESVDDYLAFCAKRGERPERAFSGRLLVRIPCDLHRRAAAKAAKEKTSLNALIRAALDQAMDDASGRSRRRRKAS